MNNEQRTLVFTETGQPELTYAELERLCELPAKQRADAIARRALDIIAVLAEQVMGARLYGDWWLFDDPATVQFPKRLGCSTGSGQMRDPDRDYTPLRNLNQAVAAMDKMIARGWGFVPKWNGLDFSAVDAFHYEKRLHVRALYWGDQPERHAAALALTVALAALLEKE